MPVKVRVGQQVAFGVISEAFDHAQWQRPAGPPVENVVGPGGAMAMRVALRQPVSRRVIGKGLFPRSGYRSPGGDARTHHRQTVYSL